MDQKIHLSHLLVVIDLGTDDGLNKDIVAQKVIYATQTRSLNHVVNSKN